MTEQEKREYNKAHYRRNRPIILDRMKSQYQNKKRNTENIIQLFSEKKTQEQDPNPPMKPLWRGLRVGTVFLIILAFANTYFLISEMARFYASMDSVGDSPAISILGASVQVAAYLKALLLEGSVFSLCAMIRTKALLKNVLHGFLIFLIYCYSIWVISHFAIQSAFSSKAKVALYQTRVTELETEITKKTALRDSYFQSNRVSLASKMDNRLQESKQMLDTLREALTRSPHVGMIWNTLITVIVFRILVMISHLICLRELSKRYRLKLRTI